MLWQPSIDSNNDGTNATIAKLFPKLLRTFRELFQKFLKFLEVFGPVRTSSFDESMRTEICFSKMFLAGPCGHEIFKMFSAGHASSKNSTYEIARFCPLISFYLRNRKKKLFQLAKSKLSIIMMLSFND